MCLIRLRRGRVVLELLRRGDRRMLNRGRNLRRSRGRLVQSGRLSWPGASLGGAAGANWSTAIDYSVSGGAVSAAPEGCSGCDGVMMVPCREVIVQPKVSERQLTVATAETSIAAVPLSARQASATSSFNPLLFLGGLVRSAGMVRFIRLVPTAFHRALGKAPRN